MKTRGVAIHASLTMALLFLVSACSDPRVIRVYNGVPVEGRFIDYEAYASYGRGLEAEKDGHPESAARWFQEATRFDPKSVEIWTHLGSALCAPRLSTHAQANDAFDEAEHLDPTYEPLFRARARCALTTSNVEAARTYAARAVQLDPDQDEAIVLHAELLEKNKHADEAARLLEGHLLRHPSSIPGWRARFDLAQRLQDKPAMTRAAEILLHLAPRMSDELSIAVPTVAPLGRVDEAIRLGNIEEARKAARHARLPPAELAVRAVAMGATKLGREQAEHVLGADPASTSARIALAAASDPAIDGSIVQHALTLPVGERVTPMSPLGRLVFAEMLTRHAGKDAARAFVGSLEPDETNDPVYEALRVYLVGRLSVKGATNAAQPSGT